MARRAVFLVAVIVYVAALCVSPALAHDHEVPTAELHFRDLFLQVPSIEVYCWNRLVPPSGRYCGEGSYHFPDAYRFDEGGAKQLSIRFNKATPPHKVWLRGWTWVDRFPQIDETYERGKRFKAALRPTLGPSGLAWYADFIVPEAQHWYLRAFVKWCNTDGSPRGCDQYVIWQFHVRMPLTK